MDAQTGEDRRVKMALELHKSIREQRKKIAYTMLQRILQVKVNSLEILCEGK